MNLNSTFENKTVIITGHNGFKGSWLTAWLLSLGAKIHGISLEPPTKPSIYETSDLKEKITDHRLNIENEKEISALIRKIKPDFIFHLAAQPIVQYSYLKPIETWKTNVLGTLNILDSLRDSNLKCTAIFITSDKCYQNLEWCWGYRENDQLGGNDPYSASKASAEIAISSYFNSYFKENNSEILIASARAGNVIGGGDWAKDRIVPDCIKAWTKNEPVSIRSGESTRPWQHVLEPLSGYLTLAQKLSSNPSLNGNSFNFGPSLSNNYKVVDIVKELSKNWKNSKWIIQENSIKESKILKLNCDKALHLLDWRPTLSFKDTMKYTIDWYFEFYKDKNINSFDLCTKQINDYTNRSRGTETL